jgi:succinoglycan biosynthesis protein ExoA
MSLSHPGSPGPDPHLQKAPRVTLIAPCRDEIDYIHLFAESLLNQLPIAGGFETIIVDGGSTDGTRAALDHISKSNPSIRVLENPAGFVSQALNLAIREARGQIIIRMDVHTRYAPDYVQQCVLLIETTNCDNVGGAARPEARGYIPRAIAAAFTSPFVVGSAKSHFQDYEGEVDTVTFGCWHKSTLEALGGFDEAFVRNQDDELNYRIRQRGGRIWQSPLIKCWYSPRKSLRGLFRQYFQFGMWKTAILRKHGSPASIRHLIPGLFTASNVVLLIAVPIVGAEAAVALTALVFAYFAYLCIGALILAPRFGWDLLPILPLTMATYQVAYGVGFLLGLVFHPKASSSLSSRQGCR